MSNFEQNIRQYVNLPSTPTPKGWLPILCKVCNDHGKKGPRAGFRFSDHQMEYNCFNCGHTARYKKGDAKLSKDMVTLLNSFAIPSSLFDQDRIEGLRLGTTKKDLPEQHHITYQPLTLPDFFTPLKECRSVWGELAREHLEMERGIDPDSYPFYMCEKKNDFAQKQWFGRLIIPTFRNNQIMYYQGRHLIPDTVPKYRNCNTDNPPLFGYDEIYNNINKPLLITEGFFDALVIDGVAVLGNTIDLNQIELINKSRRRKIYIPDMYGKGWVAAKTALEAGWEISFPEFGSCKDVNEAYNKYGLLYCIKTIMENVSSDFAAQAKIKMLKSNDKKTIYK